MKKERSILFVFHEAQRTGATIAIFRYVKWLHTNADYKLTFLLLNGGPLVDELSKMGMVVFWKPTKSQFGSLFRRFINRWRSFQNWTTLRYFVFTHIDLVIVNTIVASHLVKILKDALKSPVAWYIHEISLSAKILENNTEATIKYVDLLIANSDSTRRYLQRRFNIKDEACIVHYPPVVKYDGKSHSNNAYWPGKFVVGSSGTALSRKGYQLFILLALQVKKMIPKNKFYFVWVGECSAVKDEIEHDIANCGLKGCVEFLGETATPFNYYQQFDIFVSTSKEESFGLACAEVASMGKPLIGFETTGGLEEVILGCGGKLVPYMDIPSMAALIIELSLSPDEMSEMSNGSLEYASQFASENIFVKFNETIETLLSLPRNSAAF